MQSPQMVRLISSVCWHIGKELLEKGKPLIDMYPLLPPMEVSGRSRGSREAPWRYTRSYSTYK